MFIAILIVAVVLLLLLAGGAVVWFVSRQKSARRSQAPVRQSTPSPAPALAFRWGYIMLPVLVLLLSVIITVYFYPRLPDAVAYRFTMDGSADRWLGRGVVTTALLLPQFILTLLAAVLTWGATRLGGRFQQSGRPGIKLESVLVLMGNMVALPQIILGFALLDIFSYNLYRIHLLPLWVFALIVMVLGGIVLGVLFSRLMLRAWGSQR
ncbi:MAG: DUF1648 domain-containing protein [Dehalococcoidales bacterium]|nr:DUF1648 domain-containing protein [Dehalococcoidales bacterium]